MVAISAQAAASSICGPSADSCSQRILSPHEQTGQLELCAAIAHTAGVHEAVPQRENGGGGEGEGGEGAGGLGGE